jgi:pimeloyl-ACP methyl ester carboxylesterase
MGGAIITEAGVDPKVVGLVYIAAFAPDAGESVLGLYPKNSPPLPVEISKDGMSFFKHDAYLAAFAPDVPKEQVEFLAASQVPFSVEKSGLAPLTASAWKAKPSWYLLYKDDQLVPPAMARFMAQRAKATIVETPGSHAGFIANPAAAAKIIEEAAEAEAK